MNNNFVVEVKDVTKKLPVSSGEDLLILDNISLGIKRGESIAITGASGSGKTTLLGLLAGLDETSSGDILLLGESFSSMDEDERANLRQGKVGFVFQSFHLMDNLTALENVMLPLELDTSASLKTTEIRQKAMQALEQVGLAERVTHRPTQLSGGEQQRVALARAFVVEPAILFADEPTGNLDSHTGDEIITLLFEMQKQNNTTLVMVTHDDELAKKCQKHYRLENNQLLLSE